MCRNGTYGLSDFHNHRHIYTCFLFRHDALLILIPRLNKRMQTPFVLPTVDRHCTLINGQIILPRSSLFEPKTFTITSDRLSFSTTIIHTISPSLPSCSPIASVHKSPTDYGTHACVQVRNRGDQFRVRETAKVRV